MTADTEHDDITVGTRFESEGYHGTVLFVGPVPPTKGMWLGVEWDDPSRGKHDGTSKDGKRYFTTKHPTSGSFIRLKLANFGAPFLKELRERYGRVDDPCGGIVESEMYVRGKGSQTVVQVVGAQRVNIKQSKFEELLDVGLRNSAINGAGPEGEICQNIPNVEELDISLNLLSSWMEVARITRQLPKLAILNLSDNRLEIPERPDQLQEAFLHVKALFLTRMDYAWSQVVQCCQMFSVLQQLHICFNNITSITALDSHLSNLRLLNLESNAIRDWNHVLTLGELAKLETLILNKTELESVEFPDVPHGQTTASFPSLTAISLSDNNITQWSSIDELNKLAKLGELNFRKNPLLGSNDLADKYTILAKVPKLKLHNRSEVLAGERKGAEVDYLKAHGRAWKESGGHQDPKQNHPSAEFVAIHPRYQQLVDTYGPPEDSELKVQSSALRNSLLSITIESPMRPEKAPFSKKLPETITVQKLKALLQRMYKVDPTAMMVLTYTSPQMPNQEIELENDQREIGYYSIEEGDTLHVKWW